MSDPTSNDAERKRTPIVKGQHFVPAVYLKSFANPQFDEHGDLYVFDRKRKKEWTSSPVNTAKETHLYTLPEPDYDPMAVEVFWGLVEGKIGIILPKMVESKKTPHPNSDDYISLMYILATQMTRIPKFLRQVEQFDRDRLIADFENYARDESSRRQLAQRVTRLGGDPALHTPERQIAMLKGECDQFKVNYPKAFILSKIFRLLPQITATLTLYQWTIIESKAGQPSFVTSDKPVSIVTDTVNQKLKDLFSPSSLILYPLSPRLTLMGSLEPFWKGPNRDLDELFIARINTATIMGADQIYSFDADFTCMIANGIATWSTLRDRQIERDAKRDPPPS